MVALDDYDARDGNTTQPLQLAWDATSDAYCNPAHFVPFVLTEQAPDGPDVELGPRAAFAVPALAATNQSLALSVACDAPLSQQARTAAFRVADPDGRTLFERQVPLAPDAGGAGDSARATTDWLLRGVADGAYRASVRLLKADGTGLGVRTRPVRLMQQTYRQMSDAFRAIDVARLSQTNAFQAAAWLAAGAAADRFRSALAAGDESRMSANQREAAARIERLAGGTVAPDDTLIDLLNLTGQPEAQVTVEFNDASLQNAGVTFYCGSLPLVTARMRQFASPEEAARAVVNERHPGLVDPRVMRTVGEARAWTSTQAYAFVSFPLRAYAPDRQGLLFFAGRGRVNVLELSRLAVAKPAVAAFAEGCAEPVRQAVAAWAGRAGVTVVPLAQALTNASALVCGPTNDVLIAARLAKSPASLVTTRPGFTSLSVLAGRRLCAVHGPSRAAALQATRLAMAGEPISFAQADAVRDALVKDLAPVPLPAFALPSGMSLFCGDTHMHSFYSDGTGSPVALSLMALADQMDFSVLSDHNTLDGALLRDRLFTRFGFAATFIVGEEITTPFAHFNAYPLRTRVAWTNDANRIFRDAHSQGAVIQWNHPGYPGSAWDTDLQETGFDVSGLNAWEHYTPRIDGWEAAGRMPALVGSTDTHSGTFGVAERTVIVSMGAAGEDLAAAIRRRQTVLLSSEGPRFLYGPRRLTDLVWAALAEGQTLRTLRTERIQATLRRADLAGLLSAAPDRPVPEP
jgi:hypothetical protein